MDTACFLLCGTSVEINFRAQITFDFNRPPFPYTGWIYSGSFCLIPSTRYMTKDREQFIS